MIDALPLFIPIIIFMIPIVAILTRHQQRMAEILHQSNAHHALGQGSEIANLRSEVNELKQLLSQQAILIDDLSHSRPGPSLPPPGPPSPPPL